ncbi:DUF3883 domain-containing protein [Rhodococcus erythropolis]|uniref:DUF3883 domain-containing protein n=1 Tax=Rhodococcus erythropolis TaxID=1833 RepID=UPI00406BBDDD
MLSTVRQELLTEATSSPQLLADMAGLERYVAESYSTRTFIELLQNSDDAGADRVVLVRGDDWVICANSGRPFDLRDFRALCRSSSSSKSRGEGIGYRGIGFKSVVGVADRVHLISNQLQATFARDLTQRLTGGSTPVPLIRIPHPLVIDPSSAQMTAANRLIGKGLSTVFIMEGLNQNQVAEEFARFDSDYLLFLNHVASVEIQDSSEIHFRCRRQILTTESSILNISAPTRTEKWRVERYHDVAIAYSMDGERVVPLHATDSIAHAYLPTLEQSGFGIRINGDFSTDPSRTRITLDDRTAIQIDSIAAMIGERILSAMESPTSEASELLACLSPNVDDVALQFQKRSFRSELLSSVSERLRPLQNRHHLAPAWLNAHDATTISIAPEGHRLIAQSTAEASPAAKIAKFAGVKTASTQALLATAASGAMTSTGCAELISHVIKSVVPIDVSVEELISSKVWFADDGPHELIKIAASDVTVADHFLNSLKSCGTDVNSIQRRVGRYIEGDSLANALRTSTTTDNFAPPDIPEDATVHTVNPDPLGDPLQHLPDASTAHGHRIATTRNASAWRSAELCVLGLLTDLGYTAEDHSRQNLGYDLLATYDSKQYFVEVKSINYAGQPFALTPNEDSFARDSRHRYILALVLRAEGTTFVQFLRNPREQLEFTKQCRQWAWECSQYEFEADYELTEP